MADILLFLLTFIFTQNLNTTAGEETEQLLIPTNTTTHSHQTMETKSLDEESQMSMSPLLSRGKRNNSHFSNDLQLLIRDSYDGIEGAL